MREPAGRSWEAEAERVWDREDTTRFPPSRHPPCSPAERLCSALELPPGELERDPLVAFKLDLPVRLLWKSQERPALTRVITERGARLGVGRIGASPPVVCVA